MSCERIDFLPKGFHETVSVVFPPGVALIIDSNEGPINGRRVVTNQGEIKIINAIYTDPHDRTKEVIARVVVDHSKPDEVEISNVARRSDNRKPPLEASVKVGENLDRQQHMYVGPEKKQIYVHVNYTHNTEPTSEI